MSHFEIDAILFIPAQNVRLSALHQSTVHSWSWYFF